MDMVDRFFIGVLFLLTMIMSVFAAKIVTDHIDTNFHGCECSDERTDQ